MSKIRCNVCGYEFEFKGPGTLDTVNTVLSGIGQFTATLTGNIFTMAAADNMAKNSEFKVKCPMCHSTNVSGIFEENEFSASAPAVTINANASVDSLLKRAALFLEDEQWDTSNAYYDQILDVDPENALAYIGKIMAQFHCHYQEELQNCENPLDDNPHYKKALRFGDETQKATLTGYNEAIKARKEHERKEAIYLAATQKMQKALKEEDFRQALEEFQTVSDWKDAEAQIEICKNKIDAIKADKEKKAKQNKRLAMIGTPIVCIILLLATWINLSSNYKDAVSLMDAEQYEDAIPLLSKLHGYKDSEELLTEAIEIVLKEECYQTVLKLLEEDTAESHHTAHKKLLELGDYKDAQELLSDFRLMEVSWDYKMEQLHIRETYHYSISGYKFTVTRNGEKSSYTHKFDENGQLLERRGPKDELLEYRYHPNGKMAYSSYPYSADSQNGMFVGFLETEYDTQGMPIAYKYKYKGNYEVQWNWVYHYDEDGNISTVDVRYQKEKNEGFLTIDFKSQDLEMVISSTGNALPQYRSISEDGNTETIYNVFWKKDALVWAPVTVNEYDKHHNVIVQSNYSTYDFITDPKLTTYTYRYTYDEKGQILSSINESAETTTEYIYDEYGNCIEEITKNKDGKVTKTIRWRYDYVYVPNAQ